MATEELRDTGDNARDSVARVLGQDCWTELNASVWMQIAGWEPAVIWKKVQY